MNAVVRAYKEADLSVMIDIWNQVVEDGVGFRMPDGHYEDIIPHYYVL